MANLTFTNISAGASGRLVFREILHFATPSTNVDWAGPKWVLHQLYKWRTEKPEKLPKKALDIIDLALDYAPDDVPPILADQFVSSLPSSRPRQALRAIFSDEVARRRRDDEDLLLISLLM